MTRLVLQRGLIVAVASAGVTTDKPRLAVVAQANGWTQGHPSVTLCPLTRNLLDSGLVMIAIQPSETNGLLKPSQLMVDRLFTMPTAAIGAVVGQLEAAALAELDLALRSWLELR